MVSKEKYEKISKEIIGLYNSVNEEKPMYQVEGCYGIKKRYLYTTDEIKSVLGHMYKCDQRKINKEKFDKTMPYHILIGDELFSFYFDTAAAWAGDLLFEEENPTFKMWEDLKNRTWHGTIKEGMEFFNQVGYVYPYSGESYYIDSNCQGERYTVNCSDGYFYGYNPIIEY